MEALLKTMQTVMYNILLWIHVSVYILPRTGYFEAKQSVPFPPPPPSQPRPSVYFEFEVMRVLDSCPVSNLKFIKMHDVCMEWNFYAWGKIPIRYMTCPTCNCCVLTCRICLMFMHEPNCSTAGLKMGK